MFKNKEKMCFCRGQQWEEERAWDDKESIYFFATVKANKNIEALDKINAIDNPTHRASIE